jgi:signal peptidase I
MALSILLFGSLVTVSCRKHKPPVQWGNNMTTEGAPETLSTGRAIGKFFWELVKAFLIAMAIIIPIRYFLIQPFFVRGASMEPMFDDGEYLVIDQLSYRFREPRRGEVIIFRYPLRPSQFFIKRIVGLPGEHIRIENGQVIIQNQRHSQGVVLDESQYLLAGTRTGGQIDEQLAGDQYFVLGDNRAASSDSRVWGGLNGDLVVGRAWLRAFPFDRLDVFAPDPPGFISLTQ